MSDENINEEALELYNAAAERDPLKSQYGLLTVDTSLGAYEMWCFLWFYDANSLSNFFKYSYPYMCCAIDEDEEEVLDEINNLSKSIRAIPPDDGTMAKLADYSGGAVSMVWWGTFSDLCSGESRVAKKVRAAFRKSSVVEMLYSESGGRKQLVKNQPIKDGEKHLFLQYLHNLKNE